MVFSISFGLLFFLALWFGILKLISTLGSWGKLSKAFPYTEKHRPATKTKTFQSAQIGLSNYNGILTFSFYPDGIAMDVMVLFKFGHPKLFIPWKSITLKEKSKSIFSWNKLEIGNPPIATIAVNDKILEELNPYLNPKDTIEERW